MKNNVDKEYSERVTKLMSSLSENLMIQVDKQSKLELNENFSKHVLLSVISVLLCRSILDKLLSLSNEKDDTVLLDEYKKFKFDVQEVIGSSFSEAMTSFTGKEVDYIATIDPLPESNNKMDC